MEINWQQQARN